MNFNCVHSNRIGGETSLTFGTWVLMCVFSRVEIRVHESFGGLTYPCPQKFIFSPKISGGQLIVWGL